LVRKEGKLQLQSKTRPAEMADFDPRTPGESLRQFLLPPAPDWQSVEFDDSLWASYDADLFTMFGSYGHGVGWAHPQFPYALSLRTWFGVTDPGQAKGLHLEIEHLGGAVVWINGTEVARNGMPEGPLTELTPALDYPLDAYVEADGMTPLPSPYGLPKTQPEPPAVTATKARLASRVRTLKVTVPANVLKSGRNLLAVSLRRSAVNGPLGQAVWSHTGLHRVSLGSATGNGVAGAAESRAGTRLLPSNPLEQFRGGPADRRRLENPVRGVNRGAAMNGIRYPDPFATQRPVRIVAPRNGVGSGQAVLCDPAGLYGVQTKVGRIAGPGGATLPEDCLRVTFVTKHPLMHTLDALMPEPSSGAATVPLFLVARIPRDAVPGWYAASVRVSANEQAWDLPVQILVSPVVLPDARDFSSLIGLYSSPETVAIYGKVTPYSDAHLKLMEPSFAMQAQVGNDILSVPVILGGFGAVAKGWVGRGSEPGPLRRVPMIRWVRKDGALVPDYTILERFLDRYLLFCAPPKALALYIWDASSSSETGIAYEGSRVLTRAHAPKTLFQVAVWDPVTDTLTDTPAPQFTEPGAEQFWKPMLDGVRALVKRRGWPEDCIMIGQGGDTRAGSNTVERLRQWAPYARWSVLSHFSGDPGPGKDGRLIATGGLEVGLKESPYRSLLSFKTLEDQMFRPLRFLDMCPQRWEHSDASQPLYFRIMPLISGTVSRLALDYWPGGPGHGSGWFHNTTHVSVPGPDGAIPTVRFQMFREGVQDLEVCRMIVRELQGKPPEVRETCGRMLDAIGAQYHQYLNVPPPLEMATDIVGRSARLMTAAAELAGNLLKDRWDAPPPVEGLSVRQRDEQVAMDLPADGGAVHTGTRPPLFWSMEKNLGWKVSVPAHGSAPVTREDRVYVLHAPGTLECLNLGDGSIVWRTALSSEPADTDAWTAPLVRRDGIGALLPGGRVALCDLQEGRILWLAATGDDRARHLLRWRNVIVVSGRNVTALDAGNGLVLWSQTGAGDGHESVFAMVQGKSGVMTGNGTLLNLADGTVLLNEVFGPGAKGSCIFQASSATLFAVLTNGKTRSIAAFQLPREGKAQVVPLWKRALPDAAVTGGPLLARSRLYLADEGNLLGFDAADGSPVAPVALGRSNPGPVRLALAGERLYVETGGNGDPATVLDVGAEAKIVWRYQATGAAERSAFAGDSQVLRAGRTLWCMRGPVPEAPDPQAGITTRERIPSIDPLPALAGVETNRLPVNPFMSGRLPPVWHLVGPFPPPKGYQDAMPFPVPPDSELGDLPTLIPELGRSCSLLGTSAALRALTQADLWKDRPEHMDVTAMTGRKTAAMMAYTVIENDQDRFVSFDPKHGGLLFRTWISGRPVEPNGLVLLRKGRHLFSVAIAMRELTQSWGVCRLAPLLTDADAQTKVALDSYAAHCAFWEQYIQTRNEILVLP
jgi:outer membrane protein assembly factor BamB